MTEGFFSTDKEMSLNAAVAALRDIDTVSRKKRRSACRRMNQRFLKDVRAVFFSLHQVAFKFSIAYRAFGKYSYCLLSGKTTATR